MAVRENRLSRRDLVLLVIVLIVAGSALSYVGVRFVFAVGSLGRGPEFAIDQQLMSETRVRLAELQLDLDRVQLAGESRPSHQTGCGEDSGDVFQPAALKEWVAGKGDSLEKVVDALISLGWTKEENDSPLGDYELRTEREGWSAEAFVYIDLPSIDYEFELDPEPERTLGRAAAPGPLRAPPKIVVSARITDLEPCRLSRAPGPLAQ